MTEQEGLQRQESLRHCGCISRAHGHWARARGEMRGGQQNTYSNVARRARDVLYERATWGVHGREAELGLAQGARGVRAQGMCTSMAGYLWHQGPEGQEHSGHCWVHQHGHRAWALGRGAGGQAQWTSRARTTVMLWMQSQRCTPGMVHVGNASW
jgi:hypothetical protein